MGLRLPRLEVDLRAVLGVTGIVLMIVGAAQLVPVLLALTLGGPATRLLVGALGTLLAGGLLAPLRGVARKWTRRESLVIVVFGWLAAALAAAVPYVAGGAAGPLDALFESVSGLTTTGASIFVDVDGLATAPGAGALGSPLPLHFWRCFTHWVGGAGIVLVVVLLAPLLPDSEALRRTQRTEASFLTVRFRGSTRATLRGLIVVYVGLTAAQTVALAALGMEPFDALLHAFSSVATGGFSTHTTSMATWDGARFQVVTIAFMALGALNFAVLGRAVEEVRALVAAERAEHGRARALGRGLARAPATIARAVWRNAETRAYLILLLGGSAFMIASLLGSGVARYRGASGLGAAALDGAFNVTSVSTTTGFATEDFVRWPWAAQTVLIGLMLVGGCSGSTAGGLKMRRILIVLAFLRRELRRLAHPRAVIPLRLGEEVVSELELQEALGFVAIFFVLIGGGTLVVTATGVDLLTGASATASCFTSTGPALGAAGPAANYQGFAPAAKLLFVAAMLLGRLELYPVLALLAPSFWLRPTRLRR